MILIKNYLQFIKFGLVALSYNLFAYIIYALLISMQCNYLIASTMSFIFGVAISYFMNKKIVFRSTLNHNKLIFRYIYFYVVLLIFNLGVLNLFVKVLMINLYLAQILVIFVSALVSYNTMRTLVFRKN